MRALAIVILLAGIAAADDDDPESIRQAAPACTATHCIGIHVHVAKAEHTMVVDAAWVASQLTNADTLFSPIDVGFVVTDIDTKSDMHVATRADRDRIVGDGLHAGVVDVYFVFRLDDVDEDDKVIRGVTWRTKKDHKYIIVSLEAGPRTLAHELGHFFGLPHSKYAISIMNKTPRDDPPPEKRRFADEEIEAMKPERDRLLKDKIIVDR